MDREIKLNHSAPSGSNNSSYSRKKSALFFLILFERKQIYFFPFAKTVARATVIVLWSLHSYHVCLFDYNLDLTLKTPHIQPFWLCHFFCGMCVCLFFALFCSVILTIVQCIRVLWFYFVSDVSKETYKSKETKVLTQYFLFSFFKIFHLFSLHSFLLSVCPSHS